MLLIYLIDSKEGVRAGSLENNPESNLESDLESNLENNPESSLESDLESKRETNIWLQFPPLNNCVI